MRLQAAWLEGRLTLPELEARVGTALRCRLARELEELLADLPVPEPAAPLLAGWWRRSAALVVDQVLLGTFAALVAAGGAVLGDAATGALVAAGFTPLVAVTYYMAGHGSRSGRSVGERLLGIAVRADPHRAGELRRVTYGQAFGRAVMLYLFALAAPWGGFLNFLWPLWDRKKQAWHDKVAGTIVVRAPSMALERRRWSRRFRKALAALLRRRAA